MSKQASFYLLTDSHLIAEHNRTDCPPFLRRERGDQIALGATPQLLDAFLQKILDDPQTDTVLFTGDNVDDGDMPAHEAFRKKLEMLTAAGKKVYVIAATHDYCGAGDDGNMFTAHRYTETGTEPVPFMRKRELFDFYYDYGPRQARSVHRESGSFIVQLCDGVRLAAIVDNGDGRNHCGLFADGMQWLERELRDANEAGESVILAVHHPVLPPWEVFRHAAEHEMVGGWRELREMLCRENVRVVFTGHTHVQNIRQYTDAQGRGFFDISTIALANAAAKMRRVVIDADVGVCDVTSVGIDTLPGVETGGLSVFEFLYPRNFPGIFEKLLPLGTHDFDAFLDLADGVLPVDKLQKHRRAVTLACRKLETAKLSFAAKCGGTWKSLSAQQREYAKRTQLSDVLFTVLRHIYPGNAPYTPDTVEYAVLEGVARRLDAIVQRFHIDAVSRFIPPGSSLEEMAQDFLYNNRTGDDDAVCIALQ